MATASSSSSSQGSASGILGKRKQTPADLILYSLEDLTGSDFMRFKIKLSDFSYEDKLPISREKLQNADWITTKNLLIDTYGEEGALDVTIDVFTLIGLMGPAEDLRKRRARNDKLAKMTPRSRLQNIGKKCKESAKRKFQRIPEYNSRMGEAVRLKERFTNLLMTTGSQNKDEKEQKIRSSGRRHLQIMEKRPPTTIQALFDPDEDGFIPKIVVLQGAAGIGKTMTSKKIMLDWASGDLYQDKFDFVFYLSCREINTIPGNISLVGLFSRSCRLSSDDLVSILEDPESQRKLLTIIDGFDELRWTLDEKSEGCPDISMETHKEIILQSLLRREVLPLSSLIITTKPLAMEKLNTFIKDSHDVEIQGFTREDREEYVHKFFGNKEDAGKVLSIIKDIEVLYTICAIPMTCWIVCTVMKHEIRKDLALIRCRTTTSIYLLYLEVLLTHHSKNQSVRRKQTCLKKLCALANQGVLNQQVLFEKKDLERHGLSLDETESVFLNEDIFHWDVRSQTCYNFIHLSVQEFLAAVYYGMDDGSRSMEGTFLPEICKGKSLAVLSSQYPHLALAVQFLFGLLNENPVKTFSEITGIAISLRVKPAIIEWTMKDLDGSFPIHAISCLYETQDEDFIRSILSRSSHLRVRGSLSDDSQRNSNYSKQLSYCLKALRRESFQDLCFQRLVVDPECLKNISPFLHRCQTVCLNDNKLTDGSCTDLALGIRNNQTLRRLDLSGNNLEGPHFSDLMTALTTSRIEELLLQSVKLTNKNTPFLVSLSNSTHLTLLDLSDNKFTDASATYIQDLIVSSTSLKEIRIEETVFSLEVRHFLQQLKPEILNYVQTDNTSVNLKNRSWWSSIMGQPGTSSSSSHLQSGLWSSDSENEGEIETKPSEKSLNPKSVTQKYKEMRGTKPAQSGTFSSYVMSDQPKMEEEMEESQPCEEPEEKPANLVTPVINGDMYSLELNPGQLYCCSETGIMFQVKSQVTITYELEFESDNLKQMKEIGYDVVGPVFNITVEPGVVSEVHLPHYMYLEGLKNDTSLIKCGNCRDGKIKIIRPVKIGPSHVVLKDPSFSKSYVLTSKILGKFIPFLGKVLLYGRVACPQNINDMQYKFHLYLMPANQPEVKKLTKSKEKFQEMDKPRTVKKYIYFGTEYTASVEPQKNIMPKDNQFDIHYKVTDIPYFEVNMDTSVEKITFQVLLKQNDDPLWTCDVEKGDLGELRDKAGVSVLNTGSSPLTQHFVDKHRIELINGVHPIGPVLDKLINRELTPEQCNIVRNNPTRQDRMRELYEFISGWGNDDKDKLLNILEETNGPLINRLRRQ